MVIPVGKTEIRIQRPGYAIIGIAEASAPHMLSLKEAEKIVVMHCIIGNQRDIVPATDLLTKVETGHGKRIAENFHVVDTGKRNLLRQVFPRHFHAHGIEEGIGGIFADQYASGQRRQYAEAGSEGQNRHEIHPEGGKRRMALVGDEIVGIEGVIGLERYAFAGEIAPVERFEMGLGEIAEESLRADVVILVLGGI